MKLVSACQILAFLVQEVAVTGKTKNDETRDVVKLLFDYGL